MFLVDESYRILGQPSIEDFSAEEKVMELVEIFRKVVFHGIPDFVSFANDNQMILKDVHSSDKH